MKSRFLLILAVVIGALLLPSRAAAQPTVIATIPVGQNPTGVAVDTSTNRIYVANSTDNDVSVINGATNAEIASIPVGNAPEGLDVSPTAHRAYVANRFSNNVTAIDTTTNTVMATIPVGVGPVGVAINSSTARIYVTNHDRNNVTVIDGNTNDVIAWIEVGARPWGVAVNPTTNRIYVANTDTYNVSVIDGATNAVVATVPLPDLSPTAVAVNPTTNRIFVTRFGSVAIIDGATNTQAADQPYLAVGETSPTAVAVNPASNHVYVALSNVDDVVVRDGATNANIASLSVGDGPIGIAFNPTTSRAYVTNFQGNTVSVIEDLPEALPEPPPEPEPEPEPGPPPGPIGVAEGVPLEGGICNPVAETYPDNTAIAIIAGAVTPPEALEALWQFEGGVWTGWSPEFPAASDLTHMDFLDVVFICVEGDATFTRPVP